MLGLPASEEFHLGQPVAFEVEPAVRVRDLQDAPDTVPAVGVLLLSRSSSKTIVVAAGGGVDEGGGVVAEQGAGAAGASLRWWVM